MKIELGVALLLLLVGSSLQEDVKYEVKDRQGAVERLTEKYNQADATLTEHAAQNKVLESDVEELRELIKGYEDKLCDCKDIDGRIEKLEEVAYHHIHYCPDPASPDNTESTEIKRYEGAKVDFTCKDGYYQCQEDQSITCEAGRTWAVSGTSTCEKFFLSKRNPTKEQDIHFGRDFPDGARLIVKGKPTAAKALGINLYDKYNNIVLHASFRTNSGYDRNKLVINRLYNGWWQSEYRPDVSPWPVKVNQDFTMLVMLRGDNYEFYFDGKKLFNYGTKYRYQGKAINLHVWGDATYQSVDAVVC